MKWSAAFVAVSLLGFVLVTSARTRSASAPPSPSPETNPVRLALESLGDTLPGFCPADLTATGGGFYKVHVERVDSVKSQHTRLDQAIASALDAETTNPADSVWISHDFELRVECDPTLAMADSITVTPQDTTVGPGAQIQFTALVWRADSVVACSGECAAYSMIQRVDFRRAMHMRDVLRTRAGP